MKRLEVKKNNKWIEVSDAWLFGGEVDATPTSDGVNVHRIEDIRLTDTPEQPKEWQPLRELREGAIFETKDGIRAVKSEYRYSLDSQCACVLLESGEYACFKNKNNELVREIVIEEQPTQEIEPLNTFGLLTWQATEGVTRAKINELVKAYNSLKKKE